MEIFQKIRDFLFGSSALDDAVHTSLLFDQRGEPVSGTLELATAVTLLAAASSDSRFGVDELRLIETLLERELGKGPKEAIELIRVGINQGTDSARAESLIKKLLQKFDETQRCRIFSLAWKVILADDRITLGEESFSEWLANTLELDEEEVSLAKRAAGSLGKTN